MEGMDMSQENQELAGLEQIKQLISSGNPEAIQQALQIVDQLIQGQQAEMQGGQEQGGSFEDKLRAAKEAQSGGEENA